MSERDAKEPALTWRLIGLSAVAIVAANGLALLLIKQLSLRAAIQGGLTAMGALVFSRLIAGWWYRRRK